ncbi:hypothetical protein [Aquimarina sp. AU474]|uniref:hypothetical protein n=1 Tax=Aquimarina sp. AU474 TaxID=2108529 RepID=UPI000D68E72B|nr:hypothetical protein [Aquimarina sp. AU474]
MNGIDLSQIIIQLLMALLYAIPTLLFIIISAYYIMNKGAKTDGLLILIGNIIIILSTIIGKILFIQFVYYQKWESTMYSYIVTAVNIFSFIGAMLFVVGLFLLIRKVVKNKL